MAWMFGCMGGGKQSSDAQTQKQSSLLYLTTEVIISVWIRVFQNLSLRLIQGLNLSQCQNLQKHLETMFFITCACRRGELLTNVIALFLFATETSSLKSQHVHAGCERHWIGSSLSHPSQLALLADIAIFHAKFLWYLVTEMKVLTYCD